MNSINPQAEELNSKIKSINNIIYNLLSESGRKAFFPAEGIIAQSGDAKKCRLNATIGIAKEENGDVMCLPSISDRVSLNPQQVFPYANSYGAPETRKKWKELIYSKNSGLSGLEISTPVVCSGVTHALSLCGTLFCEEDDEIIIPDMFWGNYKLIFQNAGHGKFNTFPLFTEDKHFNTKGFEEKIKNSSGKKTIILLNFPNNPSGYTPRADEAKEIAGIIIDAAESGKELLVLIDDAYFGLAFEDGLMEESIFSMLAGAHENILAVKTDGSTKEDYVWGFRLGFLTFGIKGGTEELYKTLEAKAAGLVRGNISNVSHLSQSLVLAAYQNENYDKEKLEKFNTLKNRYVKIRDVLSNHDEYAEFFEAMPFNSGYFMCIKLKGIESEALRQQLINEYNTGIIAMGEYIRIASSSVPVNMIEELFDNIFKACRDLNSR